MLRTRLLSAAILSPLLLLLVYRGPAWGFVVLTTVATGVAIFELFRVLGVHTRVHLVAGILAACLFHINLVYAYVPSALAMYALIAVALLLPVLVPGVIAHASIAVGWLLAGPLYTGGLIASLAQLRMLPEGPHWLVLAMLLAWLGDTGGYFAGKNLGKHLLHPHVSPKKTWEGCVGGLLGSTLGAYIVAFFLIPSIPWTHALALGILGGGFGQLGDLGESLLKRASKVKDSGHLIPGHGGLLDRIDALLLTSLVVWIYATFVFAR